MSVGRFAPSPTGSLHVGNLRTALVAWLCARHAGSRFVLRVEDLDAAASRPALEAEHQRDLLSLGIDWDGPVVRQSERATAYDEAIAQLEVAGLLYPCFCTRREIQEAALAPHGDLPEGAYPGTCRDLTDAARAERAAAGRPPALRVRASGERRTFVDALHGETSGLCDDFVVRRNDGTAAYNVAVVVDDAAAGVEEVVRGEDLLGTTARQVLVAEMLDLPQVTYVHVPLVLGADGARLAKRHGAVTLAALAEVGRHPKQVLAWLGASLGLCDEGDRITAGELVERFKVSDIPRAPVVWVRR